MSWDWLNLQLQELNMSKRKIGRDAKTGRLIQVKIAERRKATAIVETITVREKK